MDASSCRMAFIQFPIPCRKFSWTACEREYVNYADDLLASLFYFLGVVEQLAQILLERKRCFKIKR